MEIVTLVENSCGDPRCTAEHGLSIYVRTAMHCLLVDTGASAAVVENASQLGIDLAEVDTVILSHGHYDHGGGILAFHALNPHARIYMQKGATYDYYHGERYIGIDKRIAGLSQVHFLEGDLQIDEELFLFTGIRGRRFFPASNLQLSRREEGVDCQDPFDHEQCLVIADEGKHILISGCAHNGILNILDRYREIFADDPDMVISGFHMMKKGEYSEEEKRLVCSTARELSRMKTVFYTGHCTGGKAMRLMAPIMGKKLQALQCGVRIL